VYFRFKKPPVMSCIISVKGEISRVFSTVNAAITGFWGRPKVFANFEQN